LEIPPHLVGKFTKDAGIKVYYAKYQAFLKAMDIMGTKFKEGLWPAPKMINRTTLIELFVSKSMWHSHVNYYFKNIADYPEMQMWLDGADGAPDDLELWGVKKSTYYFTDLAAYLVEQDKLRAQKGKGKAQGMDGRGKITGKKGDKKDDKKGGKRGGKKGKGKM
jgi:hypothetical protein